jgi:replication initiation and membrane attachment protein
VSTIKKFDFDELFSLFSPVLAKVELSDSLKASIESLAALYHLSPKDMSIVVLASLEENGSVNEQELYEFARDLYEKNNTLRQYGTVDRNERKIVKETLLTKEDELVAYFETTSPRQFLIDIANGAEPSKNDLYIIEQILFNQKLSPSVVNVLLHYVMIHSDFRLNKNYIEKIASHWARKNINTAKEAIEICKKENKQYSKWNNQKRVKNKKDYQEVPNGKLLSLNLLESSHHQLIRLTQILGYQRDEDTIAHLLNEAYKKYKY